MSWIMSEWLIIIERLVKPYSPLERRQSYMVHVDGDRHGDDYVTAIIY